MTVQSTHEGGGAGVLQNENLCGLSGLGKTTILHNVALTELPVFLEIPRDNHSEFREISKAMRGCLTQFWHRISSVVLEKTRLLPIQNALHWASL
jgi:ABC-type lipoprotein export system ATPase subunit